ncbi:MAG: hypothetical protein Q8S40_17845, partial [Falsiroseomonas sp.]|nr:hypothetical protein [Falsiroseomonas sp.]
MSGSQAVTALVFDASAAATGAAQFDAAGKRIIDANQGVVTATTRTQSSMSNLDRALGRLQQQLDPAAAAKQRLTRQQELLDRALQRGRLTSEQHARSVALATGQYDRATAAAARAAAGAAALSSANDNAARGLGRIENAAQAALMPVTAMGSRLGVVGPVLSALGPAGAAAAVGLGVLAAGFGASLRAAEQFERLSLRTDAIIRATGATAGLTGQQIRDIAQDLAATTLASTRGVEEAAQQLLTFRSISGDTFGRTLRAAQDLAATGFGTLGSSAVQLGKALEDPVRGVSALAEVGVSFTSSQRAMIKSLVEAGEAAEAQRLILAAVEAQVGGAGRAEAGGLAGAYDTLGQNVENFLTQVGNLGPLQLATGAISALAAVVGALNDGLTALRRVYTPAELAQRAVGDAQARVDAVRAQIAAAEAGVLPTGRRGSLGAAAGQIAAGQTGSDRIAELRQALAEAERISSDAQARMAEEVARGQEEQNRIAAEGAATRAQMEKDAAEAALQAQRVANDRRLQLQQVYEQEASVIRRAERAGVINATQAQADLAAAEARRNAGLARLTETTNRATGAQRALNRELVYEWASDPRQTVFPSADVNAAEDREIARAERVATEAAAARTRAETEALREIEGKNKRTTDDIVRYGADAFADMFSKNNRGFSDLMRNFQTAARQTFARMSAEAVIRPIIEPVVGQVGSAGGGDLLGGLGNLSGLSKLLPSGGLGGMIGGIDSYAASLAPSLFTSAGGANLANAASLAATTPEALLAALPAGPSSAMGVSFSGALGGIGLGFGAGTLLNGMLGGNQTGGMVGSGAGALAGTLAAAGGFLGPLGLIGGGLLGGVLGGGLGGMFGPGPKTNAHGFDIRAEGGQFSLGSMGSTGNGNGGAEAYAAAAQAFGAINALIASAGVSAYGGSNIAAGGNVNPLARGTVGGALADFRFDANDSRLNAAVSGRPFDSVEALATTIQEAQALIAVLDTLATPISDFQGALNQAVAPVNQMIQAAQRLGFGEAELLAERERIVQAMVALRDTEVAVSRAEIAEMQARAEGRTASADMAQAQREANAQIETYRDRLKGLGLTLDQTQPHVAALTAALVAQQQAATAALEAQRRILNQNGDLRYFEALAGFTGNSADAELAEFAGQQIRAEAEMEALTAELKALGLGAEVTAIRLKRLAEAQDLDRRAIINKYEALRTAAAQALDDRLFAATADTSTQATALAAQERQQARERVEAARVGLVSLTQLEAVHAAERALVIKRFAEQERQAIISAGGSIRAYIDGLRTGEAGGASPEDRLAASQAAFGQDLTLARGGDRDALARITQSADALLQSGQAMFASGGEFQALRDMVISSLEALPAVKSYDQLIYEELLALGGVIQVEVEMAAELALRADIDAALALIDTSAATPRAKAEAEAALSQIRGVLDAISVPDATTSAVLNGAARALSAITGAIAAITVAPGVTDAVRAEAIARLATITGAVSAITMAPAVPEAVRVSASAALASIAGAVSGIAVASAVTNATRLAANAALDNIIGVVSLISMAPAVPALVRERANAALASISGNVASIALAAGVTEAVKAEAITRLSTITGAVSAISMAAAVPEGVRVSATAALASISGAVASIAVASGVTNATRLAANAALDNIIGVVSLLSMNPAVPAAARERANAALASIAGNLASIALAAGVTDAVRAEAITRLATITGAVSAITMAPAVPEAVRVSASAALA